MAATSRSGSERTRAIVTSSPGRIKFFFPASARTNRRRRTGLIAGLLREKPRKWGFFHACRPRTQSRRYELFSQARASAMKPDSHDVGGDLEHGCDLLWREPFPRAQHEDLAVAFGEHGQRCAHVVAPLLLGNDRPRCAELAGEARNERVARTATGRALQEQVACNAEEPEARAVALRDGLELAPGDQVGLGEDVGCVFGTC